MGSERKYTVRWLRPEQDDEFLAVAYIRMVKEGLLSYFFWQQQPSLRGFLQWCSQPDSIIAGVFGPTLELAGLGTLHNIQKIGDRKRGDSSEVIFRDYQVRGESEEIGHALLEFAFEAAEMDTVYGITPSKNIAALRFMRKMGYTAYGPFPDLCSLQGKPCNGYISFLEKSVWAAQRKVAA